MSEAILNCDTGRLAEAVMGMSLAQRSEWHHTENTSVSFVLASWF